MTSAAATSARGALDLGALDARLQAQHRDNDLAGMALSYARGGDGFEAHGNSDAACFYWTQAWIYALDSGEAGLVRVLEERLAARGRLG